MIDGSPDHGSPRPISRDAAGSFVVHARSSSTPLRARALPHSVVIIESDAEQRESLAEMIRQEGFAVWTYESPDAFFAHPCTLAPGCFLLNIQLPGLTGLELQNALATDWPAMPVIFVAAQTDASTVVRAMKAGAVDFLATPFKCDDLLGAVRSAIERSKTLVHLEARNSLLRNRYGLLTRRERDVLSLVVTGFLNRQVGEKLGISEITVKAHRGQIMRKMEAQSLAHLVRMVETIGIW